MTPVSTSPATTSPATTSPATTSPVTTSPVTTSPVVTSPAESLEAVTTSTYAPSLEENPNVDEVGLSRLLPLSYGDDPLQVGDLRIPPGKDTHPVVVLIHGGFWRSGFDKSLMTLLAEDATERGAATWNVEYRSVGDPGGGYPGTLLDIARAIDHLAQVDEPLDLDDVTVIGHSAGGHLALWAGSRSLLAPGDPGASPVVEPHTVVAQAAVVDLYKAAETNLGFSAVEALLGGEPDEVPDHYRVAQPVLDAQRVVAVHGRYDQVVPISQSGLLPEAGGEGALDADTGTHFDVLDPHHDLWLRTMAELGLEASNQP